MTSTSSGLDLLNVAKASLGELRDDYLKWLMRDRQLPWDPADPEARAIQELDLDPAPTSAPGGDRHGRDHRAQWRQGGRD